jgi:hypothetical protein
VGEIRDEITPKHSGTGWRRALPNLAVNSVRSHGRGSP